MLFGLLNPVADTGPNKMTPAPLNPISNCCKCIFRFFNKLFTAHFITQNPSPHSAASMQCSSSRTFRSLLRKNTLLSA